MCEVIRVDFQDPTGSDGSSSSNRPPQGQRKTVRQVYFQAEKIVKFIFTSSIPMGVTVWTCAWRDQRHSSGKGFPLFFSPSSFSPLFFPSPLLPPVFPPSLPVSRRSSGSKPVQVPHHIALCVELSELTSSISRGDSSPEACGEF